MNLILVGVDFDEGSRAVIEHAKREAQLVGAEVVIAHVVQTPTYAYPGLEGAAMPDPSGEIEKAAKTGVENLASAYEVRAFLQTGDPADELLALAKQIGASLIVMGTHGRSGIAHFLLGSTTEKLIRRSPIPVLVVPVGHAAAA